MIKYLLLLYGMNGLLFISTFFSENVNSTMQVPSKVEGGKDFTIQVTLNKGTLTDFSRFQQELPAGLTAKPLNISNGEFRFQDKKIKITWLKLPEEPQIIFSYSVSVDKRLKGNFEVSGSFDYIEDNERKSIAVASSAVSITPSSDIDPTLLVDIKDFEKMVIPDLTPKADVACVRQKPISKKGNDEIIVNILVHKQDRGKFAKIEEKIPAGYIAENIDSKSGIFTFKNQIMKYLWMNLPPEDYFIVSYKLLRKPEYKATSVVLNGSFSYIEGNETRSISITQKDVDLTKVNNDNLAEILKSVPSANSSASQGLQSDMMAAAMAGEDIGTTSNDNVTTTTNPDQSIITTTTTNTDQTPVTENGTSVNTTTTNTNTTSVPNNKTKTINKIVKPSYTYTRISSDKTYVLQPDTGIYFRVQIAAGHQPVNINRYFKRFQIKEEIKRENHEGWLKYSIGSFRVYKDARDYRSNLWSSEIPVSDAFVAAYNNGSRITVQEALMISNQSWYK